MKKMREVNYIFYMVVIYSFTCLYGAFYKNKIADILKFQSINLGYLSIFIILVISYLFLFIKHNKTMEDVMKFITKILIGTTLILIGINFPKQWLTGLMVYTIIMLIILFIPRKKVNELSKIELYPSRKNLMDVLNHALGEYSLIALDGIWGSGKTTFMDIAMRDNRGKYYYIPINIMLFENRNSLKTEFLNQLKGIFKEEGIFQGSLMDFDYYLDGVSNDWVKMVKNIIFSKSKSFKEANEKLKSEIGKIEKKIVVGVDNLERIYGESEPEWKQILGFIHELQELGIKIVVMANLEEMLAIKKETGEKNLSNHEYFDKFYEFKLKLNEVTTEEIIDQVEDIIEDDKKWLKKQFEDLTKNLTISYKKQKEEIKKINSYLKGSELALNMTGNDEEHINKVSRKMEKNKENVKQKEIILLKFEEKYYKNIKNSRKIEKIIKDIKSKEKIGDIHNIEPKKYKELIFKTSVFQLFYFECFYKFKNEEKEIFGNFLEDKDMFLEYIEKDFTSNVKAVNRLLYYEEQDRKVKKRIENLNEKSMITENNLEKYLKGLKIYYQRLDESDLGVTKEKYNVIEEQLIKLEKIDEKKIHEIIKENEEFICKMNYLSNPESYKFYEITSYKFETQKINMQYRELINKFSHGNTKYNNLNEDIHMMISEYYNPLMNKNYSGEVTEEHIVSLIDLMDEENNPNIIMDLKGRSSDLFFSERAERIKLKRMRTLLNILKIEINKRNIENKKESLVITVEQWKNMENRDKFKVLQKLKDDYCYNYYDKKYENFEKVTRVLEKIIKDEKNEEFILKLESLIESLKMHELPCQIIDMASKIKMEQNSEIKEEKKGELIDFINEKAKAENYQDIYSWDLWIDKVKGIGIEVDLANKTVKKKKNDKA